MVEGACHCGGVKLLVPDLPPKLTDCNCSICRRLGALWGYYLPAEVSISGATTAYSWGDGNLAFHHCPTCGCLTHWSPAKQPAPDRMGVNFRMMEPAVIEGVRVRRFDGAVTWRFFDED